MEVGQDTRVITVMEEMSGHARSATALLKALAHETRLTILCVLSEGEKSVGQLEKIMNMNQPTVSQHLARLRLDGIVDTRRDGRAIFYSIGSPAAKEVVQVLHKLYCSSEHL